MAYLHRLIALLLSLLLVASGAWANTSNPTFTDWTATRFLGCTINANRTYTGASPSAVCSAFLSAAQGAGCVNTTFNSITMNSSTNTTFTCTINATPSGSTFNVSGGRTAVCPQGSTYNASTNLCVDSCSSTQELWNGQCVTKCQSGYVRNAQGTCYAMPDNGCDGIKGRTWNWEVDAGTDANVAPSPSAVAPEHTCYDPLPVDIVNTRCDFVKSPSSDTYCAYNGTKWVCLYQATATGATCTGGGDGGAGGPGPVPAGGTGAQGTGTGDGTCTGSINGTTVTYDCARTVDQGPPQTSVPPSTTSTTGGADPGSVPGTTTSQTTVSCTGEYSCTKTTVTTVVNNDGTKTTTTTTSQGDKYTVCQGTVGLSSCANYGGGPTGNQGATGPTGGSGSGTGSGGGDGQFGGQCGAFTCSGDAVMCEVAKAAQDLRCAYAGHQDEKTKYDADKQDNLANKIDLSANSATVTFTASDISTEDLIGGGSSGLTDFTTTVMGQTLTIPFSQYNPYLEMLGKGLIAIAAVIATYIVARAR